VCVCVCVFVWVWVYVCISFFISFCTCPRTHTHTHTHTHTYTVRPKKRTTARSLGLHRRSSKGAQHSNQQVSIDLEERKRGNKPTRTHPSNHPFIHHHLRHHIDNGHTPMLMLVMDDHCSYLTSNEAYDNIFFSAEHQGMYVCMYVHVCVCLARRPSSHFPLPPSFFFFSPHFPLLIAQQSKR
jgi:hypothetical protein